MMPAESGCADCDSYERCYSSFRGIVYHQCDNECSENEDVVESAFGPVCKPSDTRRWDWRGESACRGGDTRKVCWE